MGPPEAPRHSVAAADAVADGGGGPVLCLRLPERRGAAAVLRHHDHS
jgi:hypothetical protein